MNKHGRSLGETKTHFKMYKKGCSWMIAGVAITSFGLSVAGFGIKTAKADTTTTDTDTTAVSTTTTDNHSVTLKSDNSSQSDSTVTPQMTTSTAIDPAQSSVDNEITDTTPTASDESVPVTTGATPPTTDTAKQPTALSTSVETPASLKTSETVTNLKTGSDATFEAAKKVASETYKTVGTAQKIVRMADSVTEPLTSGQVITTGADFTVTAKATDTDIAEGTFGTSQWRLSNDRVLHIGAGELGTSHATSTNSDGISQPVSNWIGFRANISTIDIEDGVVAPIDVSYLFDHLNQLTTINGLENLDTSKTQIFDYMFAENNRLSDLKTEALDTSAATSLVGLFSKDVKLASLDLSTWDVSKVTNFSDMFSNTGLTSLDLTNWVTTSGTTYSGMLSKADRLIQVTFGEGVSIKPEMPTITVEDNNASATTDEVTRTDVSDWIGIGTGTIQTPQGRHLVDATYSGDPTDADTYVLNATNTVVFRYRDAITKAIVKTDKFTDKIGVTGTYKIEMPSGYIAFEKDFNLDEVPYVFSIDDNFATEILVEPVIEVPYVRTYQSSVIKDDGTIVAKTSGRTSYDLVINRPLTVYSTSNIKAVNATVYENEVARNASITDTIPEGYDLSAVNLLLIAPNRMEIAAYYNYQTQAATRTITNVNPETGKKTVKDLAQLAEKQGTTISEDSKKAFDTLLKWNGNQVTMTFDQLTGDTLPYNVESITYTISPTAQTRTVNYINKLDNTQILSDTINGVTDESGAYTVTVPAGYVLAPGQATTIAYTLAVDDLTPIEVTLIPAISKLPDETQTPSTLMVHYVDQTGHPVTSSVAQKGTIGTGFTVTAPTISDYTLVDPNQATVAGTYAGNAMAVTLVYKAIPETTGTDTNTTGDDTTVPATTPTTPTASAQVVTTPTTSAPSTSTADNNVTPTTGTTPETGSTVTDEDATTITTDDSKSVVSTADNGQVMTSVDTINVSSANATAASNDQQATDTKTTAPATVATLPQTSEATGAISALIGAVLLAAASLLGFRGKKHRRN